MATNLMDLAKGVLSDQLLGQMGGILGTGGDTNKTKSLFETAAGTILGGLLKKSGTPQGRDDVFRQVQDHDDSILDRLGDLMGGGEPSPELANDGGSILDGVFGNQRGGIMTTIAKALGLDEGIVGKLLMMAAPILMGVVGRHVKQKALDAVGLGSLLGEQKSHIASALPGSLGGALGFANAPTPPASQPAAHTTRPANTDQGGGGGLMKLLLPLIILAGLLWALWTFVLNRDAGPDRPPASRASRGHRRGGRRFARRAWRDESSLVWRRY